MAVPKKFKATTRRAFTEKPEFNCFKCGANWPFSESSCHCATCHQSFGSDSAFDEHRYGSHEARTRRCRKPEWMTGKGFWLDDRNRWRYPKPDDDAFRTEGTN